MSGVYLSLGAGVQSSVLALLGDSDRLPTPRAAIFADTGWEPPHVYATLEYLTGRLSYPVEVVSAGSLPDDLVQGVNSPARFVSVPFHTRPDGMMRRQCTREYKIEPVHQAVRRMEGLGKGERYPTDRPPVELWLGLTYDELDRMRPSRHWWVQHRWPLIDLALHRHHMAKLWADLAPDAPQPGKSSCVGCPYHTAANWIELQDRYPDEIDAAAEIEAQLHAGFERTQMTHTPFMHRARIPLLAAIDDSRRQQTLDLADGGCDAGWCFT